MAGLSPAEQQQLCRGLGGFLQLTEDGRLPAAILDGDCSGLGNGAVGCALLQGMLTHFLCAEIIVSPGWVFSAAAAAAAALAPTQHGLRTQIMRIFASGGMHLQDDAPVRFDISSNNQAAACALFACRQRYARKLTDDFLSSPARFLLDDQAGERSPAVVRHRDRSLETMIDGALRFSCGLWSRVDAVRCVGWDELDGTRFFEPGGRLMGLWPAQTTPASSASFRSEDGIVSNGGGGGGGCRVIMVVQPGVVDVRIGCPRGQEGPSSALRGDSEEPARVWVKAWVVVSPAAALSIPMTPMGI